jgi:peptidoglycan/xylan/chitin deacetylase (PgdA/CDA1 family)
MHSGDGRVPLLGGERRRGAIGRSLVVAVALLVVGSSVAAVWMLGRLDRDSSQEAVRVPRTSPQVSPSQPSPPATPVPTPHLVAHPQPVPILVYHHIVRRRRGPSLLYVSPAQFADELAYLQRSHYTPVTLQRVYDAWYGRRYLPSRPIVISFDDGYTDQIRNAGRLLRRYRWPAELDLIFDMLYLDSHAPDNRVTSKMVRRLLTQGWELSSHSVSHRDLTALSTRDLRHELEYSRKRLKQIFRVPVDFFCYPGGIYDRRVERATRRAGYLAATGTDYAAATPDDLYALPRIYCYWNEPLAVFAKRLRVTISAARDGGS